MKIFEKIPKRPSLLNYYLRRSFYWPDTLPEILDYYLIRCRTDKPKQLTVIVRFQITDRFDIG